MDSRNSIGGLKIIMNNQNTNNQNSLEVDGRMPEFDMETGISDTDILGEDTIDNDAIEGMLDLEGGLFSDSSEQGVADEDSLNETSGEELVSTPNWNILGLDEDTSVSEFPDENGQSSDSTRIIPVIELVEAIRYLLQLKTDELSEYKDLVASYAKLNTTEASISLARNNATLDKNRAYQDLLPWIIENSPDLKDVSTEQGRSDIALKLAVYTAERFRDVSKEDKRIIKAVSDALKREGPSRRMLVAIMGSKVLNKQYNSWMNTLGTVNRISAVSSSLSNDRIFREMKSQESRIDSELQLLEQASKEIGKVTYPISVDTEIGDVSESIYGSRHTFVCGNCFSVCEVPLPFFNLNLMEKRIVDVYRQSGNIPHKLEKLGISVRGHSCPNCGYINVVPQKFIETLRTCVFDKIKQGELNSKSSDKFTLGYAEISQSIIRYVNDTLRDENDAVCDRLPNYAVSLVEASSPLLELEDILPNWERYKEEYKATLMGIKKLDAFSKDRDLRWYGYINWLCSNFTTMRYTLDKQQIITYVFNVVGSEPFKDLAEEYYHNSCVYNTALKLINVINNMFVPLWKNEFVSAQFVETGLSILENYGYSYPEDWKTGLSITKKIRATSATENLKNWLNHVATEALRDKNNLYNQLVQLAQEGNGVGPVMYDPASLENLPTKYIGAAQILIDNNLDAIIINTAARLIVENLNSGLFLQGFGIGRDSMEKMISDARTKVNKIMHGLAKPDSRLRTIYQELSNCKEPADVMVKMLEAIRFIDSSTLFKKEVGVPIVLLKSSPDIFKLEIPTENEVQLGELFTYNKEYSIIPKIILDKGIAFAIESLIQTNPEETDETIFEDVVALVSKEMLLLDPPELWEGNEKLQAEISNLTDEPTIGQVSAG